MGNPLVLIKDALRATWDKLTDGLRVQEIFPWAYDQDQDAEKVETLIYAVRSDKDNDFIAACPQGDMLTANLTGLSANKIRIKRVLAESDENLSFDITTWSKDTYQDADLDDDAWNGMVEFLAADARRIESGSYPQYYYDSGPLDWPYEDLDGTFELHTGYVCRDPAGKSADPGGNVIVIVKYEPTA